jgi:hypothetical protein
VAFTTTLHLALRLKEEEEHNLYSPSGPSWPALGLTSPSPFALIKLYNYQNKTCYKPEDNNTNDNILKTNKSVVTVEERM